MWNNALDALNWPEGVASREREQTFLRPVSQFGQNCPPQFSRRICSVRTDCQVVYDSGIKMHDYMLAGLNAARARHTMFTGVILWRMAPWPYTLKACDAQQGRSKPHGVVSGI
jgi:hypothetical protein